MSKDDKKENGKMWPLPFGKTLGFRQPNTIQDGTAKALTDVSIADLISIDFWQGLAKRFSGVVQKIQSLLPKDLANLGEIKVLKIPSYINKGSDLYLELREKGDLNESLLKGVASEFGLNVDDLTEDVNATTD